MLPHSEPMLGSTVDTCFVSLRSYFSAMIGSTVDTWFASVPEDFGRIYTSFLREGRRRILKFTLSHFSRVGEVCTVNASDA